MINPRNTKLSRAIMGVFYIFAGTMHFVIPEFYIKIMPPYIPYHSAMVIASGIIEILLGFGVLGKNTRRYSAWGIILLLIAVFPANIHAYLNSDQMSMPAWLLLMRLPLQGLLVYWAYTFTKKEHHSHQK